MSETVYLMGKLNSEEGPIGDFAKELEERGHVVMEKWWELPKLSVPYMDNIHTSRPAANAMADAAYSSSVSILFPDGNILGAAVELGSAIAGKKANPDKLIIIVNPFEVRQSVFYTHEAVIAVRGLIQVRAMDWY